MQWKAAGRQGVRSARRGAAFLALVTVAVALSAQPSTVAARRGGVRGPIAGQPNVLIIVADDQRADGTLEVMPRTRSIFGDGGTSFPNGYVTTPLCCPSRSTIFSGRYAHNHDVHINGGPGAEPQLDHSATMQRYLDDAGYNTAIVGKLLTQWTYANTPPYWDRFLTFNGGYVDLEYNLNGTRKDISGYTTDVVANYAERFLGRFEQQDARPWFLYVAPHAPHKDFTPAPGDEDSDVGTWNGNPAVFETDVSDKAPWAHWQWDLERARPIRDAQLRTLLAVDRMVDRIFDRMNELDEQDTIAFYIADNGFLWGEHTIGAEKRFPYLQSIRVPFMVRWPGNVGAGVTDPRIVANVDLLPTVLDATGVDPALVAPLDGRSLLSEGARKRLLLEYYRSPDRPGTPSWAGFITKGKEFVEWYQDDLSTVTFREYYDLNADPWQLVNLLHDGTTSNDPNVTALQSTLNDLRDCVGASCP